MIGRIRSASARRAAAPRRRNYEPRRLGPAQTRLSAGQVEQAYSLGVGRNSPDWIAAIARGQLLLQVARLIGLVRGRYELVGSLEELVDDLDLVGSGAQSGKGVDEALQAIFALDDLARVRRPRGRSSCSRLRAPCRRPRGRRRGRPCRSTPSCSNANERSTVAPREGRPGGARSRSRSTRRRASRSAATSSSVAVGTGRARPQRARPAAAGRRDRASSRITVHGMSPISVAASPASPLAVAEGRFVSRRPTSRSA